MLTTNNRRLCRLPEISFHGGNISDYTERFKALLYCLGTLQEEEMFAQNSHIRHLFRVTMFLCRCRFYYCDCRFL